jgi:S1-C subfamily serine protease
MHDFLEKGYVVLRPEGWEALKRTNVPRGAVLVVSCTYLGLVSAAFNSGAKTSCEVIDYASRKPVYTGNGQAMAVFDNNDIEMAVRNALREFPETGRKGSVSMVLDLGIASGPEVRGASDPTEVRSGTGFFIDTLGDIVTNAHVVDSCRSVTVGGRPLRVLRIDRQNDLALLRRSEPGEPLPLRGGRPIRPGESLIVLGFPLSGLLSSQASVTTGTVSALAGPGDDTRFIQMSAPVQPGNSGGPVLDQYGAVVAVVVAKLNAIAVARLTGDIPENVNFALSEGTLRNFLDASDAPYQTIAAVRELSAADVAARSRRSVVQLACMQ